MVGQDGCTAQYFPNEGASLQITLLMGDAFSCCLGE